jgi:hypothetical protein
VQTPVQGWGYLEVFGLLLAYLVVFRFVFASIHILIWKWNYNFNEAYKIEEKDLAEEFKQLKRRTVNYADQSSDDEAIEEEVNKIF